MKSAVPTIQNTEVSDTRPYVVTVIASSEIGEQFPRVCVKHGGAVVHERPVRKVRLAYPIGKQHFASYFSFDIATMPSTVSAMRAELISEPSVIRALVERKRVVAERTAPSDAPDAAISAPREERTRRFGEAALTNEDLQKKIQEILN